MRFCLYGASMSGISYADLLAHAAQHHDVMARAEDSGSEGCYCEVARWNPETNRWERWAFEKFFGGEHPSEGQDPKDASSHKTAALFAAEINAATGPGGNDIPFVHQMPNWGSPRPLIALVKTEGTVRAYSYEQGLQVVVHDPADRPVDHSVYQHKVKIVFAPAEKQ